MKKLYDCVTYYTIENWEVLVKKAKGDKCTPISTQIAKKFKITECQASRIVRDVLALKNCGII